MNKRCTKNTRKERKVNELEKKSDKQRDHEREVSQETQPDANKAMTNGK